VGDDRPNPTGWPNLQRMMEQLLARLGKHHFFAQPVPKPTAYLLFGGLDSVLIPDCVGSNSRAAWVKLPRAPKHALGPYLPANERLLHV
jgi:hypothetical protein